MANRSRRFTRGLVDCGVAVNEAFTITARVFRSGGLTKDAVYLRGLRGIISHLGAGGVLDGLWLGKLSLTDLPHINDLRDRGILHDPVLVPRYLDDPAAQQRLANVTASTTPSTCLPETVRDHELIGGPR